MATFKQGLTTLVKQISNVDLTTEHAAVAAALLDVTGVAVTVDAIPASPVSLKSCQVKFVNDTQKVLRVNSIESATGDGFKIYGDDSATLKLGGHITAGATFESMYYIQPVDGTDLTGFTVSGQSTGDADAVVAKLNDSIEVEASGIVADEVLTIRIQYTPQD